MPKAWHDAAKRPGSKLRTTNLPGGRYRRDVITRAGKRVKGHVRKKKGT